ncbi:MAG: YbaB/EbfC family nucleoid-associated protein [Bacillota bacterium]|nr:YbaB/EbfC family nucleoid-associated protein [Bacillota bacterium]
MLGNFQQILKQAQKIKEDLARLEEELKDKVVEATAGGGMVRVAVNGRNEVVSVTIEREALNPDDAELLQDMVQVAVNEALRKAREMAMAEMAKITGNGLHPSLLQGII